MSGTFQAVYSLLTVGDVEALDRRMTARSVKVGDVLIGEGEKSDTLFLLSRGSAVVRQGYLGGEVELAELKQGEVFGEISLLLRTPATASVVMTTEGEIKTIDGAQLRAVAEASPGMEARLYHSLAKLLAYRLSKASRITLPSFVGG